MSAETVELEDRHRPGRGQAAGDRLADACQRDRLDLAGRDGRGCAGAAAASAWRRSTSSATIRPSGPGAAQRRRSMPRSRAIRRASGDALIRPPFAPRRAGSGQARRRRGSGRGRLRRRASARLQASSALARPAARRDLLAGLADHRDGLADRNLALPATAILSSTPEASASTSWVTLSVSSS